MAFDQLRCAPGMPVVGSDGDDVGLVKECRESDFLVDRSMQRDIYVPYSAVEDITGDTIALNIPADQVDDMGWAKPSLASDASGGQGRPPEPFA